MFSTKNSGTENRKEVLLPLTFPEFYNMKTGARDLMNGAKSQFTGKCERLPRYVS